VADVEKCPTCKRPLPKERSDAPIKRRSRLTLTPPPGEEGILEDLLIQLVEKYEEAWPEDAAAMREGIGLVDVGQPFWMYRAMHFAAYAALTQDIVPVEAGG